MCALSLKQRVKSISYWVRAHWPQSPHAVILMYHSVDTNPEFFTVQPSDFAAQLEYLATHGYQVRALSDIDFSLPVTEKTVVITFDDGWADNFTVAFPLLQKYQFPATIFVSSRLLGTVGTARRGTVMPYLTIEQCKIMAESGLITFGSHCLHHPKLTTLSLEEQQAELFTSAAEIEQKIGRAPTALAYPYGNYNQVVEDLARKKYATIVTVEPGIATPETPTYRLPRNAIDSAVPFDHFMSIVRSGRWPH